MTTLKERALELWHANVHTAATAPSDFRKGIITTLVAEFNCSVATASTCYNGVKNSMPAVAGLGRAPRNGKPAPDGVQPPQDICYSVIELVPQGRLTLVGRTYTYALQGDASEQYDHVAHRYPANVWVMIQGMGPLPDEVYKLGNDELEIKRSR